MYKYSSDISNDKESVFQYIDQRKVFEHIFGDFEINRYICSPFRDDNNPGCWISYGTDGKLYFTDYTCIRPKIDMIGIIQKKYEFNFPQAIDYIIKNHSSFRKTKIDLISKHNKSIEKESNTFFVPKPFDKYAKKYWKQYGISSSNLIEDNVFSLAYYSINDVIISPHANEASYVITFPNNKFKICRPGIKDKKFKWFTNVGKNTIGGLDKLSYAGHQLIITKSYKDWRVLTNLGLACIWFQNEGMIPDLEILDPIISTFNELTIWFDNDDAGVKATNKLVTVLESNFNKSVSNVILPTKEKDPADVIKAGNKEYLKSFINNFVIKTFKTCQEL